MIATHRQTLQTITLSLGQGNKILQEGGAMDSIRLCLLPEAVNERVFITVAHRLDRTPIKIDVTDAVKEELKSNFQVQPDLFDTLKFLQI